jgi:uncharacterized delta-60 repeat protein
MFIKSRQWTTMLKSYGSSRRRSPRRSAMLGSRLWLERLEARTLLNAGDLDPTFGVGGKVTTDFQQAVQSEGFVAAQQPDGKIVTLDTISNANSPGWGLVRYNPDGTLDTSFGSGGTVIGTNLSTVQALVIQGDGRIIVAGSVQASPPTTPPTYSLALIRYNPDGSLDVSFGSGGRVVSSLSGTRPIAMAIQPDSKIVVSFVATVGIASTKDEMVRYNPDGSLDNSFGTGGTVMFTFTVEGVAVQPDDKVIAVGQANSQFAVARFNPNGSLDPTFGGGVVTTTFSSNVSTANAVVIQTDGKIVVGGGAFDPNAAFAMARYNGDGSLDVSFGSGGKVTGSSFDSPPGLTLQSDGKIVAARMLPSPNVPPQGFLLERYTPNGTPDATFGMNGLVSTGSLVPKSYTVPPSVLVESGGRIVLAGTVVSSPTERAALLGLASNGVQDATFGAMGLVLTTFIQAVPANPAAVLFQPDGKIVVASTLGETIYAGRPTGSQSVGTTDVALTRYNPDGSLDATFGSGGRVTTNFGGSPTAIATTALLLPDGSILVVGETGFNTAQVALALARYKPDGSLDTTFGTGGIQMPSLSGATYEGGPAVLEPDGKLLLPGMAGGASTMIRLNADGSQDTGFVAAPTSLFLIQDTDRPGLAVQADGKILLSTGVVAGVGRPQTDALLRFNANGSLDATFGSGGIVLTRVNGKVYVQADGRIVVEGLTIQAPGYALDRFFSNGNPDTTFGTGGEILLNSDSSVPPIDFVVQPDNKIVLARKVSGPSGFSFNVERFDPNGNLDASFGAGGQVTVDVGSGLSYAGPVVRLQGDGRIVVAGNVTIGQTQELELLRFLGDNPITDNNRRFVTHLYLDLLERSPDSGGLTAFTTALNQNQLTRMQLVQAFTSSVEYHTLVVQGFYGRLLGRPADSFGLNSWVSFLNQGGTADQLEAIFLGSAEYFNGRGGGTANGFLQALYTDILGRAIDTSGSQSWGNALATNSLSRAAVATAIQASQESDQITVEELYTQILHRPVDSSGLNTYTTMLQQGQPETLVLAILAGSDEYFNRV